ncbi:hypothetical protein GDO86_015201 [Hymenochirus boettgeri]|uniref:Uncharacterized protein n=1 Tax=Hymenochirus boettgeri TaxID=247094 RepID=A0A8T2JVP2_9PIPI|nr:hypothetical protein GDO86_015201 [Hymenochirus boettgeri]
MFCFNLTDNSKTVNKEIAALKNLVEGIKAIYLTLLVGCTIVLDPWHWVAMSNCHIWFSHYNYLYSVVLQCTMYFFTLYYVFLTKKNILLLYLNYHTSTNDYNKL